MSVAQPKIGSGGIGGALTANGEFQQSLKELRQSLHELRKEQESLRGEVQRLQYQQEGFSDASRMLTEALMTWAQTEPAQMWRETQRWLREIQGMSEQITKRYFTDEAQRLLISKVVDESVAQLNDLMAQHREKISQRANRAIERMDNAFQIKLDDMAESAAEQYAQTTAKLQEESERVMRDAAEHQKKALESLVALLSGASKATEEGHAG